jgi:hypothetical protein
MLLDWQIPDPRHGRLLPANGKSMGFRLLGRIAPAIGVYDGCLVLGMGTAALDSFTVDEEQDMHAPQRIQSILGWPTDVHRIKILDMRILLILAYAVH